jgi:hypothetical protein
MKAVEQLRDWASLKNNAKLILNKYDLECGLCLSGPAWDPVAGFCEHSNEPSGSIRNWEFRAQLSRC